MRALSGLGALVLAGVLWTGPARAATLSWSGPIALGPANVYADLVNVACPSPRQCTALDAKGRALTFDPTSPGNPTPTPVDYSGSVQGLACPSTSECVVVDGDGGLVTFNPARPAVAKPVRLRVGLHPGRLTAVACPSMSQCTALDDKGSEVTFNPTGANSAHLVYLGLPSESVGGLACPTTRQCTAIDNADNEVTFDPTAPGSPTPTTIDGGHRLYRLACPSTSQCTAVDYDGREVTFNPTAPGTPAPATIGSLGALGGLACPAVTQCTAVDTGGREVTFNPMAAGNPTGVLIERKSNDVACPALRECLAVGADGSVAAFDPTSPGSPKPVQISPVGPDIRSFFGGGLTCLSANECVAGLGAQLLTFNPLRPGTPRLVTIDSGTNGAGANKLTAIACPASNQCTALDNGGRELTFNPAAPGKPTPVAVEPVGPTDNADYQGLACPSVTQCTVVYGGDTEVTFNPRRPSQRTHYAIDRGSTRFGTSAVACPSTRQCTAVDDFGVEITFNPAHPTRPISVFPTPIHSAAIACPSTTQCTSLDELESQQEVTFNPQRPVRETPRRVGSGAFLPALVCPSRAQCIAVNSAGEAAQGDPRSRRRWSVAHIAGAGRLDALACWSPARCVALDEVGNEFLGVVRQRRSGHRSPLHRTRSGTVSSMPASTARARPALAVSTRASSYTRWVLEGRQLTVTLPGPVLPYRRQVTAIATCGEDAAFNGGDPTQEDVSAWAALARGTTRVAGTSRTLRVRLARDVANRVNLCAVSVDPGADDEQSFNAAMSVRRGQRKGCAPGPLEHVAFRHGNTLVTVASGDDGNIDTVDAYRACLMPRGKLQLIDAGGSSGGGGGASVGVGMFTSAGAWLAWADSYGPHDGGPSNSPTVKLLNLAAPKGAIATIDAAPGPASQAKTGLVLAVAVGNTGTVAWIVDPSGSTPSPSAPAVLYAERVGGSIVMLDRAASSALGRPSVSADGQTVTWTDGGAPRSAHLS